MNVSEFTETYARRADDELLALWADRSTLVPEAVIALESELRRRELNKQNAFRIKKRRDALAAREKKGFLINQVAAAKYERSMRHFVGWEEPEFYSPYSGRDIRNTFAYIRHKYRVWKAFRDHTGRWPVYSIWFHFLSWIVFVALVAAVFVWVEAHSWGDGWSFVAIAICILSLLGARSLGARLMRKLDWKRCGTYPPPACRN
ncbi:MAG TPA: hypothetical protein VD837_03525 [Terriglobales bacterium]|nr:hypothetical protein [Terriglobales bacterium]